MASGGGIKGFYKQKKKNGGGVSKPPAASKKATTSGKRRGGGGASLGSGNPAQTPALIAHGSYDLDDEEYGEEETKLRKFDMEMRYGPCVGMTRLQRWQRANSMGLNPPKEIEEILLRYSSSMSAGSGSNSNSNNNNNNNNNQSQLLECLWEGRV